MIKQYLIVLIGSSSVFQGKTLLQKLAYFLSVFLNKDFGYKAHYYGPYSSIVDEELTTLKGLEFIKEEVINYGYDHSDFEIKKYNYSLTEKGNLFIQHISTNQEKEYDKVKSFLKKLKKAGFDGDYNLLSIAAKIHYLRKNNKDLELDNIQIEAKKYGWHINDQNKMKAMEFLKNLNLAS